jgi:hypothetical protein
MDFRPVEAIGAIRPVSLKRPAENVEPPFAIDGAGRMDEDSYGAESKQPNRGLEEADVDELKEGDVPDESAAEQSQKKVNVMA